MKEELRFEQLKAYLTREYMKLSDERDRVVEEKIQLETKREREEKPLFAKKDLDKIKRLFSPLSDEIYENGVDTPGQNNEISRKITELEEKLNSCDFSMEEIKEYLTFLQQLEDYLIDVTRESMKLDQRGKDSIDNLESSLDEDRNSCELADSEEMEESLGQEILLVDDVDTCELADSEKMKESLEQEVGLEEENTDITEMIFDTAEFLEEQYPEIQFVVDFDDDDYTMDYNESANLVRIITYVLSSTIESVTINSVEIEIKKEEGNLLLSIKMLYNDRVLSQHSMRIAREIKLV